MLELFRFPGGVKPVSHKKESAGAAIRPAPLPERLVVPLRQSAGRHGHASQTCAGDRVLKGQLIGAPKARSARVVHASTSGTVLAIESRMLPHPSGLTAPCAIIEPDGADTLDGTHAARLVHASIRTTCATRCAMPASSASAARSSPAMSSSRRAPRNDRRR